MLLTGLLIFRVALDIVPNLPLWRNAQARHAPEKDDDASTSYPPNSGGFYKCFHVIIIVKIDILQRNIFSLCLPPC